NSIVSNTGIGIDLGNNGVTANDVNDVDAGANNLQNFPVLTSVTTNGGSTFVGGTLNSGANTTFTLDLFASSSCDPSGFGEGQRFLGSASVTTSGNNAAFSVAVGASSVGESISATATDPSGNTSEFSQSFSAGAAPTADLSLAM